MTILVTGNAGFIGFHLCKNSRKEKVVIGLDNITIIMIHSEARFKELTNYESI